MNSMKIIASSIAAAFAGLIGALFVGLCFFGYRVSEWTEGEGRIVGVMATLLAVMGAAVGLRLALQAQRRHAK